MMETTLLNMNESNTTSNSSVPTSPRAAGNNAFASPLPVKGTNNTSLMMSVDRSTNTTTTTNATTSSQGLGQTSMKTVSAVSGKYVSKLKDDSISRQFTLSLKSLYEVLDQTEPHYIRCIKPNIYKQADRIHSVQCLDQLRCAGEY